MAPPVVRLVVPNLAMLEAAVAGPAAVGPVVRAEVAAGWDVFPQGIRRTRDLVADDPRRTRWGVRLFVLEEPAGPLLVGWGGFKGPPRDGAVEVGFAVAPRWEGRGIATAAVRALVREAFASPDVQTVHAHTLTEPGPSPRVLEKAGFIHVGDVPDEDVGTAWGFRLDRPRLSAT